MDFNERLTGNSADVWEKGFERFLKRENPWQARYAFPIWRTIEIGTHETFMQLIRDLHSSGVLFEPEARKLLSVMQLSKSKQSLDLVVATVKELGFLRPVPLEKVHEGALYFGLNLCPAEVGPQLTLQLGDQGRWTEYEKFRSLMIAMTPLELRAGEFRIFGVGMFDQLCLTTKRIHLDYTPYKPAKQEAPLSLTRWDINQKFVFVK